MKKLYKVPVGVLVALALLLTGVATAGYVVKAQEGGDLVILPAHVFNKLVDILAREPAPVAERFGAFPGPELFGPIVVHDSFTEKPAAAATTTGREGDAATTLSEKDLLRTQYHAVNIGGALNTDFTYTLPASSTLQSFVNSTGARSRVCWFNVASSTSVHALVFAAGTGIDFRIATTSNSLGADDSLLTLEEDFQACIEFIRQPRADGTISSGRGANLGDIDAILSIYDVDLD